MDEEADRFVEQALKEILRLEDEKYRAQISINVLKEALRRMGNTTFAEISDRPAPAGSAG